MKKKIKKLFSNLCCSHCKNGFDEDCKYCGKDFGVAFLGINNVDVKSYEPLEIQEGPEPITYDDVIDAHRFIKTLDADWQKHLPK